MSVLSDFSYNPFNKNIDLFEFRKNALPQSSFHINVFNSVAQEQLGNGQPFEVHMIVHDVAPHMPDISYALFIIDEPQRAWTYYKTDVIVDKYLNDISSIDFEIHHTSGSGSGGGFAPNDFRHIYIQYTPFPEDKTYTSVLADYNFQTLNGSNYWNTNNTVDFVQKSFHPQTLNVSQSSPVQVNPTEIQLVVDISFGNGPQPIRRLRFDTNGYQPETLFFFGVRF